LSIEIQDEKSFLVKSPYFVSTGKINQFIKLNESWIREKFLILEKQKQENPPRRFVKGEKFMYLGRSYELKIVEKSKYSFYFDDCFYLSYSVRNLDKIKEIVFLWYKKQAYRYFVKKTRYYADFMNVQYQKLRVSSAVKQWGSCGSKDNINLAWRLIMAPEWVIDYVIVHELAHLRHRNHSKKFWIFVKKVFPQYQEAKKWLNRYGHCLKLD